MAREAPQWAGLSFTLKFTLDSEQKFTPEWMPRSSLGHHSLWHHIPALNLASGTRSPNRPSRNPIEMDFRTIAGLIPDIPTIKDHEQIRPTQQDQIRPLIDQLLPRLHEKRLIRLCGLHPAYRSD